MKVPLKIRENNKNINKLHDYDMHTVRCGDGNYAHGVLLGPALSVMACIKSNDTGPLRALALSSLVTKRAPHANPSQNGHPSFGKKCVALSTISFVPWGSAWSWFSTPAIKGAWLFSGAGVLSGRY